MEQTGYSLVSTENVELQTFNALPNFIKLANGDDVYGAFEGSIFSDKSRLIPVMRDDNPPGKWYKRLREARQVFPDQVVVTVVYSDEPDIADMRAHMFCTPFQGRMALIDANLFTQAEAVVSAADDKTKTAWEYALIWERTSPMIESLAQALGLSDTQVDDLFKAAQEIQA